MSTEMLGVVSIAACSYLTLYTATQVCIYFISTSKIEGNYRTHSLRATGTTTLFDAGVPESIIQKHTGHRLLDALQCYERVTPCQEIEVSHVLSGVRENEDELFLDTLPESAFSYD